MSTLIKIVSKTMSNMAILETKIEQQNIEIMRLKHKVCALTAKVNVVVLDDAEGFIDVGIYKESLPGIATPVEMQAAENILCTNMH